MPFTFNLYCSWLREVVKFQDYQIGLKKNAPQTPGQAFVQIYDGEQIILFILSANIGSILYVRCFYPRLRNNFRATRALLAIQTSPSYNTVFTFRITLSIPYNCSNYCVNISAFCHQYSTLRLFIVRTTTLEPGQRSRYKDWLRAA